MIQGGETGVLQRGPLPITMRLKKIIDMAALDAGKGNPVDTVHLVLAMLREGENAAAQLLFNAGVTADKFVAAGTAGGGDGKKDAADEAPGEESGGEEGEEPVEGEEGGAEEEEEEPVEGEEEPVEGEEESAEGEEGSENSEQGNQEA